MRVGKKLDLLWTAPIQGDTILLQLFYSVETSDNSFNKTCQTEFSFPS